MDRNFDDSNLGASFAGSSGLPATFAETGITFEPDSTLTQLSAWILHGQQQSRSLMQESSMLLFELDEHDVDGYDTLYDRLLAFEPKL